MENCAQLMVPFLRAGDAIALVVDMVRWLWGTCAHAFLDRDGALGPDGFPSSRDRPARVWDGSMGTLAPLMAMAV